jgi:AcrR family transcriptional regulator
MPPKGERRKQQIIDTAKEMFIENGFQSTHIGQVCEKLDIARGTVYQYFSNKREIIYSILETVIEKIEENLDQEDLKEYLNKNPEPKAVFKIIMNRIAGTISILVEEPIVIMLIFKDIVGIDKEVVDRVNRSVMHIAKIVGREVEELKTRGIFKTGLNSKITASMLIGAIMMLVYEYDKKNLDVLYETVINQIASNYLKGVMN